LTTTQSHCDPHINNLTSVRQRFMKWTPPRSTDRGPSPDAPNRSTRRNYCAYSLAGGSGITALLG
jgi:hypothetical protein